MRLPAGEYFGATLRQRALPGFTVTLSRYAGSNRQPWHTHDHPTLFLLLQGDLRDGCRRSEAILEPLTLVFHPTHAVHRCEVGPRRALGINLEVSPEWLARHSLEHEDLGDYT